MNRIQTLCYAAFISLAALTGAARADDYSLPVVDIRFEERAPQPVTCAQATQFAWFKRQMELSDGYAQDNDIPVPAECQREVVASSNATAEEIHIAGSDNE
jgi:hypothetical protein